VLKIAGVPKRPKASSAASIQKSVLKLFDRCQERTRLVAQSITENQIDKSPPHRDIGDIRRPDMIRTLDLQTPEQVRIHWICRMAPTGMRLAIQGMDAHLLHQSPGMAASDHIPYPSRLSISRIILDPAKGYSK